MRDQVLQDYASRCFSLASQNEMDGRRPEWVLQHLGQDWLVEFPTPGEANVYVTSPSYIRGLLSKLGKTKGVALELLAEYLMQSMPGCRTVRRARTKSTEFDLVCSMEGYDLDFRSELGRYFVCECKDWAKPAGFDTIAKFCRVLDSVKAKFGILFSRNGISGAGTSLNAEREQLKVFQDRGMVIVVVDADDLEAVAQGKTSSISCGGNTSRCAWIWRLMVTRGLIRVDSDSKDRRGVDDWRGGHRHGDGRQRQSGQDWHQGAEGGGGA